MNFRSMNIMTRFSVYFLLLFVLSACSNRNTYESALPKDAAFVLSVDFPALLHSGGLDRDEVKNDIERLVLAFSGNMQSDNSFVSTVLKDPLQSGVDVRKKFYFFVESQAVSAGLLASVENKRKIDRMMDFFHEQHLIETVHEDDGYTWATAGKYLISYSSDAFLMMFYPEGANPLDLRQTAARLLRQKSADGFAVTDVFSKMMSAQGEIVSYASLDLIPGQFVNSFLMGTSANIDLQNVKALTSVQLKKGKITAEIENLTTDTIVSRALSELYSVSGKISGHFLDRFPATNNSWMSTHLDGNRFYDLLCKNPTIRQQLQNPPIPLDLESIIRSINGDVTFAFPYQEDNGFIVYAEVTNSDFLRTFKSLTPLLALTGGQMQLLSRGASDYLFTSTDGSMIGAGNNPVNLWFGVRKNYLYITNREGLLNESHHVSNMNDAPWSSTVLSNHLFILVRSLPFLSSNPLLYGLSQMIDYTNLAVNGTGKVRLDIVMKNQEKEVLVGLLQNLQGIQPEN